MQFKANNEKASNAKTRKQKLMVSKNAYYARKTKCVNQLKQLLKSQSYLAIWYCYLVDLN